MKRIKQIIIGVIIIPFTLLSCYDLVSPADGDRSLDWERGDAIEDADDNHFSESELERFQSNAEILALEYILDAHPDQPEIPNELVDLYYNGLIHVANSEHPEAEKVLNKKSIEARGTHVIREIIVNADTTEAVELLENWREKEAMTGNSDVDDIIAEYNISVKGYSELKSMPYAMVTMQTEELLNVLPIAKKFEQVDGITSAGPNGIAGDGSTILAEMMDDHLRLQFVYGWGDCPAGCINKRYWDFNVYQDGTVEFHGVSGSSL